jgi:autotransporter-associated beta strand protein
MWAAAVSGNWSDSSKWTNGVPDLAGAGAIINSASTARVTVTLDHAQTIGTLELGNSQSAGTGYAISGTGANASVLTLDNVGSVATIRVDNGTHDIEVPVGLVAGLSVSGSGTLAFGSSSSITGIGPLTMTGTGGTLILSGTNSYQGATTVNGGTLIVRYAYSLRGNSNLNVGDPSLLALLPAAITPAEAVASGTEITPVPEPGTLALLGAAICGAALYRHRGRKRRRDEKREIFDCCYHVLS